MREILFRGKVVNHPDWKGMNGKWVEGFFVNALDEYPDPGKERIPEIVSLKACNLCTGEYSFYETFEVDPNTVGQYTGLVDKNGKKIFEGDFIKASWGYTGVVEFDMIIRAKLECVISDDAEVIGNIHDNPELIERNRYLCRI